MVKNKSVLKLSDSELERIKKKYFALKNETPSLNVHAVKIQLDSGIDKTFWVHSVCNGANLIVSEF